MLRKLYDGVRFSNNRKCKSPKIRSYQQIVIFFPKIKFPLCNVTLAEFIETAK